MKFFLSVAIAIVGFFAIERLTVYLKQPALPTYAKVPEFSLVNQDGQAYGSQQMDNKISVVQFFFASCPYICPVVTGKVSSLASQLVNSRDVIIVSISVDPQNDTANVLKEYSSRFNTNSSQWNFLTGEVIVVNNLLKNVFFLGSIEEKNTHSTRLTLVDRNRVIRGYYNSNDPVELKRLVDDVARLE